MDFFVVWTHIISPIWTGGQNGPLRVFAKHLKNGLTDIHQTLCI